MFQPTHQIVSMRRGATSNSQSPMWRCVTKDNQKVNIFQHSDPNKNTYRLFTDYWPEMNALVMDGESRWQTFPIDVQLTMNGKWWDIIAVGPRPSEAKPDPIFVPNLDYYRRKAIYSAQRLFLPMVYFFDTETTGITPDSEIINIGIIDGTGEILLDRLLVPSCIDDIARSSNVTGLTADMFENASTIQVIYYPLVNYLCGQIVVAYNAQFDLTMLDQTLSRYELAPIVPMAVYDAMTIYSEFAGLWDVDTQRWKHIKLTEAAEQCGFETTNAHHALADTLMMYQIVKHIAES